MAKRKRIAAAFVVFIFLFVFVIKDVQAAIKVNGIVVPRPNILGLNTSYKVGDRVSISFTSSDISTSVQYRAVLKNIATGKTTDILKGFTSKYYNPKYKYPLVFTVSVPGKYSIEITSKKARYKTKYSRSTVQYFTVLPNTPPEKLLSIDAITKELKEGEVYKLPNKVVANFENGSKEIDVKWKSSIIDTSRPGTYLYEGNVDGYSEIVNLTLIVRPVELTYKVATFNDLSKLYITFSKKIDKGSVKSENFRLLNSGNLVGIGINVIDDKRICITTSDSDGKFKNDDKYILSFDGIYDINGNGIEPVKFEFIPSKMVDKNLVDTIKAGYLEAPEGYNPLGEFLYFGYIPVNVEGMGAKYDINEIPLVKINGILVYNPVSIAQYGLQYYSYYIKDGYKENLKPMMAAADWLVANQDRKTGKWLYNFPFDVGGMSIRLESGWSSAMGQGQAISLLVRAYNLTQDERYIQAAELGLEPLKVDVENDGLTRYIDGHPYYEEYPTDPPSYALNGFMFTLLGLYDLSYIKPESEATRLYNEGMETLKFVLPNYDLEENRISIYHLGHITKAPRSIHTSNFYHMVHIIQLKALDSVSPDPILEKYYRVWKEYIE